MNNLLKAESYKLLHNKSFWGLFLFSFVLGSIMLFDSNRLTDDMLDASLYNIPLMYFLIIIFAVPFIGEDFGNRTIHSFVSGGHKRMDVLLAKTVIYLSASEGILVGPLLFHSFIGIVMGSVEVVAVTEFLEKIGLILIHPPTNERTTHITFANKILFTNSLNECRKIKPFIFCSQTNSKLIVWIRVTIIIEVIRSNRSIFIQVNFSHASGT